ncbi:cobalamin biosynthesis protein CobD [Paenibacillus protaetiae]|uniref:Cobalamin biosynthesis protein CobD n=2 Tax=Paenibacillus protaetiae TaxID=2509456 RepID=A0A4P6EY58_9BACL|nr:cobalamin biosynthesis protein CobD [Paenibacillus protaetiae]
MTAAAIAIDWIIGDPKWPTHPVIWIGRLIRILERKLLTGRQSPKQAKAAGIVLALVTLAVSWGVMQVIAAAADWIHPWLGYAVSVWFISTTIAVKGLKDAGMHVYRPLVEGRLDEARKYAGYIVSRDTDQLTPADTARAAVETIAENTVDAFVSPVVFALLGGAPLAMLYRAANTLDSMVGYRNEQYIHFGWCSARTDDALNYIPARIAGLLMSLAALVLPRLSAVNAVKAAAIFARRHPSPNSGIPESAAAGAMGVELGGVNYYFGVASERARMGWKRRELQPDDIKGAIRLLYATSILVWAGALIGWALGL